MTREDLKRLAGLPADIRARKERIGRLDAMLVDGPLELSDTVKGSTKGTSSMIRTFVIRGLALSDYDRTRKRLAEETAALRKINLEYAKLYADAVELIETLPDPELRTAMHMLYMDGDTYEDVAGELGNTPEAWRKRLARWFDVHGM